MRVKNFMLFAIIGILASCGTTKENTVNKNNLTVELQKMADEFSPKEGFEKHIIALPALSAEDEMNRKIEIVPGQEMLVDCNHHGLMGELVEENNSTNGLNYYLFKSDGQVFSTQMACPDVKKTSKFVQATSILNDYRSNVPYIIYANSNFDVKYAVWVSSDFLQPKNKDKENATQEAIDNLKPYPNNTELEQHVIFLPPLKDKNENNLKVEIFGGKTIKVDCNKHRMMGEFETKTVEGFGYDYYVFKSNGHAASTRMACPDDTLHDKFVYAESITLRYNSRLPIVVYTPKGFEVNYKIWETDGILN